MIVAARQGGRLSAELFRTNCGSAEPSRVTVKHSHSDVPRMGNVAVSRHAQDRMKDIGIPERMFERVLLSGLDTPIGTNVVWREKDGCE